MESFVVVAGRARLSKSFVSALAVSRPRLSSTFSGSACGTNLPPPLAPPLCSPRQRVLQLCRGPVPESPPPLRTARVRFSSLRGGPSSGTDDAVLGSELSFPPNLSPRQAYDWLCGQGKIQRDDNQIGALASLESLYAAVSRRAGSEGASPFGGGRYGSSTYTAPAGSVSVDYGRRGSVSTSPVAGGGGGGGSGGGLFASLFGRRAAPVSSVAAGGSLPPRPPLSSSDGIYLHGGTGCGKTMLLDLFYRCAPTPRKRRTHFNAFMLDVHARLHAQRESGRHREGPDPLARVAEAMAAEAWLVCFDEVQVTDVADALILRRLFEGLFDRGLVVVATSNRAPRELYLNGLQRELFLPFVDAVEARCVVHHLRSPTDYRVRAAARSGHTWLAPALAEGAGVGAGAGAATAIAAAVPPPHTPTAPPPPPPHVTAFEASWRNVVAGSGSGAASPSAVTPLSSALLAGEEDLELSAQGRAVRVPRFAARAKAARFSFEQLCVEALGTADFQVLAQNVAVVYLERVPRLTLSERNELRRFILLVDTLYEHHVKLVVCAEAPPSALFSPIFRGDASDGGGAAGGAGAGKAEEEAERKRTSRYDEVFAFDRTFSRLMEMQTDEYLNAAWRPNIYAGSAH